MSVHEEISPMRQMLRDFEERIEDGIAVDIESYGAIVSAVAAEDRMLEIAAKGQAARDAADAQDKAQGKREVATRAAAEMLQPLPEMLAAQFDVAVRELVELWDQVAAYRATISEAGRTLNTGGVPASIKFTNPSPSGLDPDNHAIYGPGDTARPEVVVSQGKTHQTDSPGMWVRAAIRSAADQRDGMATESHGAVRDAIGRFPRPKLPAVDHAE